MTPRTAQANKIDEQDGSCQEFQHLSTLSPDEVGLVQRFRAADPRGRELGRQTAKEEARRGAQQEKLCLGF